MKGKGFGRRLRSLLTDRHVVVGVAVLLLLYSVVGFLLIPTVARPILTARLSTSLQRQVTIDKIRFNPFVLSVTVYGFTVLQRDGSGPLMACKELYCNLQIFSLWEKALIVKAVRLADPEAVFVRRPSGSFNIQDLAAAGGDGAEADAPFRFSVNNIEISGGRLTFDDQLESTVHRVEDLRLALPFISNFPYDAGQYVHPAFSALINDTRLILEGKSKPFAGDRASDFAVIIRELHLPRYLNYLPGERRYDLPAGILDFDGSLGFSFDEAGRPALTLAGGLDLSTVVLSDREGTRYVSLPSVRLEFRESNLLAGELRLKTASIQSPDLLLVRNAADKLLPAALFMEDRPGAGKHPGAPGRPRFSLQVADFSLADGQLRFRDHAGGSVFEKKLHRLEISVSSFSTALKSMAGYTVSAETGAGENVRLNGRFSVAPFRLEGSGELKRLLLPSYAPYYEAYLAPSLTGGRLDVSGRFGLSVEEGKADFRLDGGGAALDGLRLTGADDGAELVDFPQITATGVSIDSVNRRVVIGSIGSAGGRIMVERKSDGTIEPANLLRRHDLPPEPKTTGASGAAAWEIFVNSGTVEGTTVGFRDAVPMIPVAGKLVIGRLEVAELATVPGSTGKIRVELVLNDSGSLSAAGGLGVTPPAGDIELRARDIPVAAFAPYLREFAALDLRQGNLAFVGSLQFHAREPAGDFALTGKGRAEFTDFVFADSAGSGEIFSWRRIDVGELEGGTKPARFRAGTVDVTGLYGRMVVQEDGRLNLKSLVDREDAKDSGEAPGPEGEPPELAVDEIVWKDCRLDFTDRSITPVYQAAWEDIGGQVRGLSSLDRQPASVRLQGRLDRHSPLIIEGEIEPFFSAPYLDLRISSSDIELSSLSPYFGRYIGRKVEKGKLSLDLEYMVKESHLTGRNGIYLDQFTLGESVESPDAAKLPIGLAVALLKNRKGEITVNVPVEGDLDDPRFSLGGVIMKAIFNLIAKAATSPFALLGALIPEGQDLRQVEFQPGGDELAADQRPKLETLAKAMFERPGLQLELRGRIAPDADEEAIRLNRFEQLLRSARERDEGISGRGESPQDSGVVAPEMRERYVQKLFREGDYAKPEGMAAMSEAGRLAAMEVIIREHIQVNVDDLRLLAMQRASRVKDFLVENGPVSAERIFLVEPSTAEPVGGKGETAPLVEVAVK